MSEPTERDVEALAEEVWADEPTDAERDVIRLVLHSDWYAERITEAHLEGAVDLRARVEAAYDDAVVLKGSDGIPYWAVHRDRLRAALQGDAA